MLARNDALYEPVNIRRAIQCLSSVEQPLLNNIRYASEALTIHADFMGRAASLLNTIPTLRTREQKVAANAALSAFFEKILRNKAMAFTHQDLVFEAQTGMLKDLAESFRKGYVFHVTLEEELRKLTFVDIKPRIPAAALQESEQLEADIRRIVDGAEKAYGINMKMVLWAVMFYSCIKLAMNG